MRRREQTGAFLEASGNFGFKSVSQSVSQKELYDWTEQTCCAQGYIARVTGLSLAHAARLIGQYGEGGKIQLRPGRERPTFRL